ncbi:MAG: hypothetical protein PHW73_01735 [Atribacterota bacterium]|nr:hypothetical protein [Atribacterota bacterium]
MNTVTDNLVKFIEAITEDINRDRFATLIFKVRDGKILRFEKTYSINSDELEVG